MTMLTRAAALLLVAAATAAFAGPSRAQTARPAATVWICFYTSEQYPQMEPIGFLEENGRRCPFIRNDETYGRLQFLRREPWI